MTASLTLPFLATYPFYNIPKIPSKKIHPYVSVCKTNQLKLPAPTDTAIELCASGRMRVEPLLLAHNPRVFDGYGKAYKIGDYAMIIFKKRYPASNFLC